MKLINISARLALPVGILLLSACAMPTRGVEVLKVNNSNTHAIVYPSDVRGAYFIEEGSNTKFCAEPAPDVALETLEKLTAKLTASKKTPAGEDKSAEANFSPEFSAKVVELAGRTDLLLVAREMLYRACELSANNKISSAEVLVLYKNVTQLIGELATSDRINAEAELSRSITEREKAAAKAAAAELDK